MDHVVAEMIPQGRGEREQGPEHTRTLTRSQEWRSDGNEISRCECFVVSHNVGNGSWLVTN